ncbi:MULTISPECIES: class I SAM-dependent methyltransferase [unclassified Rhodococcus (in: high G+C Gram-positive bacteria)]|jgi:ubiquinone/menaquinone biosynthesis C-methylase UbiE|uniref:class I SAM-dependent methyltransferase n=1 Tax=unclassified Rhodococcus (in: high G+C Gram-positive bacteria) TaxID=192944 RepID=UPI00131FF63D|nr:MULTISPECIES: methyltransferase domain-containing protein [unclassified Rhodococcus (in: high G+C Gram-positive bacteria)]QHE68142.1 Ubiquinone/menaquinone biosynthesis methyltransferase UbiE [Rhodococcus sp. WAY2]
MTNPGAIFDEARQEFDRLTTAVWSPAGQSLVFQLGLHPGDAVLDVCCGAGASAIPAATAVGPAGLVHAVDLADELLEQGRVKSAERGLKNIEFVCADATTWEPPSTVPSAGYDALACSYGVFFLPHMDAAFTRLAGLVRPGGKVGITVWRRGALREFADAFLAAVARQQEPAPEQSASRFDVLDRIDTPDGLHQWLADLGAESTEVRELSNLIPATPEFAWDLVLGGALRGALSPFDDNTVEVIRRDFLQLLTERAIHDVDAGTLVGTAVVTGRRAT